MSFNNAINYRQDMILTYTTMLATETSTFRIEEINRQIALCQKEIEQLKEQQFKIFGKKEPLKPITTIFEPDREKPGSQKVTVLNGPELAIETADTPSPITVTPQPPKDNKRLGNSLRDMLKSNKTASAEDSLKAKIAAAKAGKKA